MGWVLFALPKLIDARTQCLLVGISSYSDSRIEALRYSVNDVAYMEQVLSLSSRGTAEIKVLIDQDATWMNLRKALFSGLSGPGAAGDTSSDTLIFYFSGHGYHRLVGNQFYQMIALYDTDPDNPGSYLFEDELFLWLTKTTYAVKILLFDSCFPPDFIFKEKEEPSRRNQDIHNIVIVSATSPEKKAWEIPLLQHSIFTYILANGLKGLADKNRDGIILMPELCEFIRHQTSAMQSSPQNPDTPVLAGDQERARTLGLPYQPEMIKKGIVVARESGYGVVDIGTLAGQSDFLQFYDPRDGRRFKPIQIFPLYSQLSVDSLIKTGDVLLPTNDQSAGELILDVVPWAMVELDGKPYGYSPVRIKPLFSGDYQLKLSHPELGTQTRLITLQPGEVKRLKVKLK